MVSLTTGPPLPTLTDSCLHLARRCSSSSTTTSARAKNKKGPKPGEHVQLLRMKRDHNKGFRSEKCYLEASIALCFEWAG